MTLQTYGPRKYACKVKSEMVGTKIDGGEFERANDWKGLKQQLRRNSYVFESIFDRDSVIRRPLE